MANKNRKNQDQGSVKNTELNATNNQKENVAGAQLTDTNRNDQLKPVGQARRNRDGDFNTGRFLELLNKYKRYLAAGVLFAAMVVVLVKCTGPVTEEPKDPVVKEEQDDTADLSEEFQVDAIPEINALIGDYYTAHAAGDVAALEKLARPMSDTEKSFIKLNSEYVEAYNNISCYTKAGLKEGEYIVSVYVDIKYKDVETQAPGLDRFYLRTDENGSLYIDNAYSQFNQSNMEVSTEADVQALLNEYEKADDFLTLWANVQKKFEDALAADPKLEQMANETIPNALLAWAQSLVQPSDTNDPNASDTPADQTGEQEGQEGNENPDDTDKPDEETPKDDEEDSSDGEARTAYAMDGINMRKGPSTDDDIIVQIVLGTEIKIYPDTEKDGWVKASYDGKKGYVKREYVTTKKEKVPSSSEVEEDKPAKALPEGAEITLTDTVNVRVSMSETADKVGVAAPGDVVKVIMSYAEGWTKVEWNGQTGYMKTDLIQ